MRRLLRGCVRGLLYWVVVVGMGVGMGVGMVDVAARGVVGVGAARTATGGGTGAGGCGPGGSAGCPGGHGSGGISAGDPVDIATGIVFTTPATDLLLPGPLPLLIERFYRSGAIDRDVGLGWGWSHSLSWEVTEKRRALVVIAEDGISHPFARLNDSLAEGPPGWLLARTSRGFQLDCGDGVRRCFELEVDPGRFALTAIVDANDNTIHLQYDRGQLVSVIDSAGRTISVIRGPDGRIARFAVATGREGKRSFFTYHHDERGDLRRVVDALGHEVTFGYDEHRLASQRIRSGLTFRYRYDDRSRCLETWAELPESEKGFLDAQVPAQLADRTPAKGIYHCKLTFGGDYVEVVDSISLKRYFTNTFGKVDRAVTDGGMYDRTYDANGKLTAFVDPLGNRWSYEYDDAGRMTAWTDPMEARTVQAYDDSGALARVEHPDGTFVAYERDARGNVIAVYDGIGLLIGYSYDRRGLVVEAVMPNGGVTRWAYDDQGNPITVVEPDGTRKALEYDALGRIVAMTDATGRRHEYSYSPRGELVATHIGGRAELREYDDAGRLAAYTSLTKTTYRFAWGGLHYLTEARMPDGGTVTHTYNREGWHISTTDEDGRTHRNEYDVSGHVAAETTFDGRRLRYKRNLYGALTRLVSASGRTIDFEYDPAGRLVRRIYDDGTEDRLEWDALGRFVGAINQDVAVAFERDGKGRIRRDVQRSAAAPEFVEHAYDAQGQQIWSRSSRGLSVSLTRDLMGRPSRMEMDSVSASLHWDPLSRFAGMDVGCARLRRHHDGTGTATLDFLRDRDVAAAPGEPAWVDAELQDARWVRRLELDDCGRPQRIHDTEQGQSDLAYDGAGRIASVQHQGSRGESYGFSPSGDVYEIGPDAPARRYAPGGRLLERGDERYEYDLDGNMVRRYRLTGVERLDEWRYEWNAAGLLSAVERPDGHRVENVYDALARRVAQRVLGAQKPVVEKRFVWDGDALVHEIIRRSEASWDPVEEVKSYVFDDNGLTLLALRTGDGPWHFAVPAAQPDLLFDETGQITSQATTSVWGDATWTSTAQSPVGLPGHYFDAETGLIYNRHRYYDPHLGRYISPDPAGVEGGIHLYAYAESRPHELMDPLGVYARTTIVDRDGNVIGRGRSKDPKKQQIHPAVAAAFPRQHGGMNPSGTTGPLGGCGEPAAMSNYLYEVELGPPPVNLNPNTSGGRANLRRALARIPPDGIRTQADGATGSYPADEDMAPCPNCSRMLSRMRRMYGGLPANAAAPGYPGAAYPQTTEPNTMVRQQSNHPDYQARQLANSRRRRNQTRGG
jgi:RHS repeat-associated protein